MEPDFHNDSGRLWCLDRNSEGQICSYSQCLGELSPTMDLGLKKHSTLEVLSIFDSGMLVSWVAFSRRLLIIGQLSQDADRTKSSIHPSYYMEKKPEKVHIRLEHDGLCYPVKSPVCCFHQDVIRTQGPGNWLFLAVNFNFYCLGTKTKG